MKGTIESCNKADEWGASVVGCRGRKRAWNSIDTITLSYPPLPTALWGPLCRISL